MTGQRFGALVVLRREGSIRSFAAWRCRCDCGQEKTVSSDHLRRGRVKACIINGHTWQSTQPRALSTLHPAEYNTWEHMWRRCIDKKHKNYKNYGGRRIRVCKRWRSFDAFFVDMGEKPTPLHTIERENNNKGYNRKNCRWATAAEQRHNMRTSVHVEYGGQRMLLIDLTEKLGLDKSRVYARLKMGWSLEDAITIPIRRHKKKRT